VFPVGIGLRDSRSQKRDRGTLRFHPSKLKRPLALSFLSPLASASRLLPRHAGAGGMTKERVGERERTVV
jgi:hypothetical protein